MYTSAALIDTVERTHRSLAKLITHVGTLPSEAWKRTYEGFGAATIPEQIEHQIGAQRYWVGVIEGRVDADDDAAARESAASLEAARVAVQTLTESYLRDASTEELNTPRAMMTWGGKEQELVPARIILRTVTHAYQHQGQVAAMCRLAGHPIPAGLDFPLL